MKKLFIFAAGAAVGAAVALLLAPKSGEELREDLKDMAQDATKRAHDYCEQVKKDLDEAAAAIKKEA